MATQRGGGKRWDSQSSFAHAWKAKPTPDAASPSNASDKDEIARLTSEVAKMATEAEALRSIAAKIDGLQTAIAAEKATNADIVVKLHDLQNAVVANDAAALPDLDRKDNSAWAKVAFVVGALGFAVAVRYAYFKSGFDSFSLVAQVVMGVLGLLAALLALLGDPFIEYDFDWKFVWSRLKPRGKLILVLTTMVGIIGVFHVLNDHWQRVDEDERVEARARARTSAIVKKVEEIVDGATKQTHAIVTKVGNVATETTKTLETLAKTSKDKFDGLGKGLDTLARSASQLDAKLLEELGNKQMFDRAGFFDLSEKSKALIGMLQKSGEQIKALDEKLGRNQSIAQLQKSYADLAIVNTQLLTELVRLQAEQLKAKSTGEANEPAKAAEGEKAKVDDKEKSDDKAKVEEKQKVDEASDTAPPAPPPPDAG